MPIWCDPSPRPLPAPPQVFEEPNNYRCTPLNYRYITRYAYHYTQVFKKLNTPPVPINALPATLDCVAPGTQTTVGDVLFAKCETKEALEKQAHHAPHSRQAH